MPTYDQIYEALGKQEIGYSDDAKSHSNKPVQAKRLKRIAAVAIILRDNLLNDSVSEDSVQIGLSLEGVIAKLERSPNRNELGGLSKSSVYTVIQQLQLVTGTKYGLIK